MRVLVACEFSGIVREAFTRWGWDAWSCDLLESEQAGNHILWDAIETACDPKWKWDLLIAHPPCTFLANSGVRWLYNSAGSRIRKRWDAMKDGAEFFKALWEAPIKHICVENPIMHSHAKKIIGVKQSQIIQPWQFGHGEIKATCLWLKNLPPLKPTKVVHGREPRVHHASPGLDRWKERSRTLTGIADAFARQWTSYFLLS